MKKIYLKPEVAAMELSAKDCLMVSGFDESMSDIPGMHPGIPAAQRLSSLGKTNLKSNLGSLGSVGSIRSIGTLK